MEQFILSCPGPVSSEKLVCPLSGIPSGDILSPLWLELACPLYSLCVPKVQDNTWRKISNDAVHIDVVYLTPLQIHLGLSLESLKFKVFPVAFTSKMAYSD